MNKMLKIIPILFVVAAVVSIAGCASKTTTTANSTQGASEQVTPTSTPVATPAPTSLATPTPSPVVTPAVTPVVSENNTTQTNQANENNMVKNMASDTGKLI